MIIELLEDFGSLGICLLLMIVILIIGSAIDWLGDIFIAGKNRPEKIQPKNDFKKPTAKACRFSITKRIFN